MTFLILWLLFGIGCGIAASNKKRSVAGWFFLGILLGPFGLLFILLLKPLPESESANPRPPITPWGWSFTAIVIIILLILAHFAYSPDVSPPKSQKIIKDAASEPPGKTSPSLPATPRNTEESKEIIKYSYVGVWKQEMRQIGGKWKKADHPFTLQLLPNGKLVILMPVPHPIYRITGTWKILDDGRLQISEEEQNGELFEKPSISVFSLENGKLTKPGRPYINENEKAQFGVILKRIRK